MLVSFARRTLDPEAALDLTAETFAQAYLGWRGLRGDSREERQATPVTLSVGQEDGVGGGCDQASDLARFAPTAEVVSYVADPC